MKFFGLRSNIGIERPEWSRQLAADEFSIFRVYLKKFCGDSVFQVEPDKREINGIRVDSPTAILANRLCALLSRSEIRDLVDLRELEKAGFDLRDAIEAAEKKDTGFSPIPTCMGVASHAL